MRWIDIAACFFMNGAVQVTRTILSTLLLASCFGLFVSVTHFMVTFRDTLLVSGFSISLFACLLCVLFLLKKSAFKRVILSCLS